MVSGNAHQRVTMYEWLGKNFMRVDGRMKPRTKEKRRDSASAWGISEWDAWAGYLRASPLQMNDAQ